MRIGRAAGLTDTGRRRHQNEDAFVCQPPVFAVADGMGGAQAGELASQLAATVVESGGTAPRDENELAALVRAANARIFERATTDPLAAGMGTTLTVVVVDEHAGMLALGHVGDSRAYRVRAGALERLTDDHSLVGELMRSGRLTEAEASAHPARSVITRALGTEPEVEVDTFTIPVEPGDLLLLCSDGLSSMLSDERIAALAIGAAGPAEATEELVTAANEAGGEDNVTVVAFEIVDGEPPERPPPAAAIETVPVASAPTPTEPAAEPDPAALPGKPVRRHGAG
ncbi:MAG: Stp1/IreP family PP2C-type Ser/Thr phosphatase, partial [Gaiella sp.]